MMCSYYMNSADNNDIKFSFKARGSYEHLYTQTKIRPLSSFSRP